MLIQEKIKFHVTQIARTFQEIDKLDKQDMVGVGNGLTTFLEAFCEEMIDRLPLEEYEWGEGVMMRGDVRWDSAVILCER